MGGTSCNSAAAETNVGEKENKKEGSGNVLGVMVWEFVSGENTVIRK